LGGAGQAQWPFGAKIIYKVLDLHIYCICIVFVWNSNCFYIVLVLYLHRICIEFFLCGIVFLL
jgi:type IV secretory pathway VirB3-like protein